MRLDKRFSFGTMLATGVILTSCVDPFEPETVTFESALVIEASITDELKIQEVFISRTFAFEDESAQLERGAIVEVEDDLGTVMEFLETAPGQYRSATEFSAESGRSYRLKIRTGDGRTYSSEPAILPSATQLDSIYAERIINDDGVEGMAIFADSFDPTGSSKNYRYTYEETYRIIAPRWFPEDLILDPDIVCGLLTEPRDPDTRLCYRTDLSNDIIQFDTNGLQEDRVSRFMVRFINRNNFIISHRYSILVRQLVQSDASFSFYQTLKDFSGSESLFSDTQPGFLSGNISSDTDEEEKVLGYFEVATVDTRRIFFNYDDFFPGEPLPPYINACNESAPVLANPSGCVLSRIIEAGGVRYAGDNSLPPEPGEGPFLVVPRVCGDCTEIGSTEVPEFWTD